MQEKSKQVHDLLEGLAPEERESILAEVRTEMRKVGLNKFFTAGMEVWVTTLEPPPNAPLKVKLNVVNVGNEGHLLRLCDVGPDHENYPKVGAPRKANAKEG